MIKLAYQMTEAAEATGISRPMLYRLIRRGDLTIIKVGARTLILASVLEDFLKSRIKAPGV